MVAVGYFVGGMRLTKLGHFFDNNQSDNWHILVPML